MQGGGRSIEVIKAEIATTQAHLRSLYVEKRGLSRTTRRKIMGRPAQHQRNRSIVADFDAGAHTADIARSHGLTYSAAQGILYRAGRTLGGRMAIRAKARGYSEHGAPA